MTITELARRDSLSKPVVSRTVKKLVEQHDLEVTRDGRGRISGVAVVQFDHLRKQFTSSIKVQAAKKSESVRITVRESDSLDEARRKSMWLDVEKKEFERQLLLGKYILAEKQRESAEYCGRAIQNIMNQLPNKVDEIAAGITKEGTSGGRVVLRRIRDEILEQIADRLESIGQQAPKVDLVDAG